MSSGGGPVNARDNKRDECVAWKGDEALSFVPDEEKKFERGGRR